MFKAKVEKVIAEIQSKNKDIKEFPSLIEVCNPGESGFIPRTIGETGYLLLCPVDIDYRKSIVQGTKPSLVDYMGISPYIMVVMESGSPLYKPFDIVQLNRETLPIDQNGLPLFTHIIVKGALTIHLSDSSIIGKDQYLTDLAKNCELLKPIADA